MQFQLQFYWWGSQKKESSSTWTFYIIFQSDILSTGGDALSQRQLLMALDKSFEKGDMEDACICQ
jgi:hypothetical protein